MSDRFYEQPVATWEVVQMNTAASYKITIQDCINPIYCHICVC